MVEDQIGKEVVDSAVLVHRELGHGLLETVYEAVLAHELRKRGLVERLNNAHKKQLLTYLRLADLRLGYLLDFGAPLMRDGITRIGHRCRDPSL